MVGCGSRWGRRRRRRRLVRQMHSERLIYYIIQSAIKRRITLQGIIIYTVHTYISCIRGRLYLQRSLEESNTLCSLSLSMNMLDVWDVDSYFLFVHSAGGEIATWSGSWGTLSILYPAPCNQGVASFFSLRPSAVSSSLEFGRRPSFVSD